MCIHSAIWLHVLLNAQYFIVLPVEEVDITENRCTRHGECLLSVDVIPKVLGYFYIVKEQTTWERNLDTKKKL